MNAGASARRVTAARRRRRVPLVLQASSAECGLACLAMISGHFGRATSVRELRAVCEPGRDGVSAGALVRLGRELGFEAAGYPATGTVFAEVPMPVIAHWQGDHFVVVTRVGERSVDLVDPAVGRRRLPRPVFDESVGKVALALRPGEGFTARADASEPFWRSYVRSLLRVPGTVPLLLQVLAVSIVTQLLVLAMPLATRTVVDELSALDTTSLLTLLAVGMATVTVAQLVTGLLRSSLLVYLQGRLDTAALLSFTAHLLRLPLRYFEMRSTGDIMTRYTSIASLRELMTSQTLSSLLDTVLALSYLVVLLFVDVPVALAVTAVLVAVVALLCLTTRVVRERMTADLVTQATAQGYVVEALEGIATIKAAAAENHVLHRLADLVHGWMTASTRRSYLAAVIESVTTALRTLTPLLVLWLCAFRVVSGTMTAGTMLAVTWLASAIMAPLATVMANGQRLQLAGAQLQRLADVLETPAEPVATGQRPVLGRIDVDRVSFRYDSYSRLVLDEISVHVEPGQRIAIVGATGSGKTTLGMLLLGLYNPTSGEIRYDGEPLDASLAHALRGQIGVVLQEPFVFSGTIRDNITLGDTSIPDEEVRRAGRLACLDDEVMAMPNRYATTLAQRGTGLSGGQRQRLALARALIRRPLVLLLDEATSHLDADTEARLHRNLSELRCVQLVIAHRLSTVRDADQILVLHDGRVVEAGTHDRLLALRGHYARLVAAQMDSPQGDSTADADGADPTVGKPDPGAAVLTPRSAAEVARATG